MLTRLDPALISWIIFFSLSNSAVHAIAARSVIVGFSGVEGSTFPTLMAAASRIFSGLKGQMSQLAKDSIIFSFLNAMVEAVEATAVIIFNGLDFSPCRVSASANPVANEASCCLKIAKILSSNGWRKWLVCDGRNWTFTRDSNAASRDRECDGWPGDRK